MKITTISPVIGAIVLSIAFQAHGQRYIQRDRGAGQSLVQGDSFNWDRSGDNPLNTANDVRTVKDGKGTYQRGFT
ncbi:MAG: hypothetical protein KJN98_04835, partial [Pontiella sp.]|nr:hypothetical protein [Pontiella sp.]